MGFYVNPSADGFAEVLADGLYVDKSELIGYINDVLGTSRKLTASTRTRRFGKSFAARLYPVPAQYIQERTDFPDYCGSIHDGNFAY